jgi:hypothetical protein
MAEAEQHTRDHEDEEFDSDFDPDSGVEDSAPPAGDSLLSAPVAEFDVVAASVGNCAAYLLFAPPLFALSASLLYPSIPPFFSFALFCPPSPLPFAAPLQPL